MNPSRRALFRRMIGREEPKARLRVQTKFSMHRLSRRHVLKATIAAGFAAMLHSCITLVPGREHGFEVEYRTSKPSSAKEVIESFPNIDKMEIALLKEVGTRGKLVGMTLHRNENFTQTGRMGRNIRSTVHTHGIGRDDPRLTTYPSVNDLKLLLDRVDGKIEDPNLRYVHVASVNNEKKVMGYSTIFLSKRWLELEKKDPHVIRNAIKTLRALHEGRLKGAISDAEYCTGAKEWYEMINKLGLRVRLTAFPGYSGKSGFILPK